MTCKKFVGAGKFHKLTLSKVMNLVCTMSYKKYITDILYVMSMIKDTSQHYTSAIKHIQNVHNH